MTNRSSLTAENVRAILRQEVAGNQSAWAKAHHMSSAYVSDVLSGKCAPGAKILTALGLVKIVSYQPATDNTKPAHAAQGRDLE